MVDRFKVKNGKEDSVGEKEKVLTMDDQIDALAKSIRHFAITKQLNFLIGSGASADAIPLMNDDKYKPNSNQLQELNKSEDPDAEKKFCLKSLFAKTMDVSKRIISGELVGKEKDTQSMYDKFLQAVITILNLSNSRRGPKNVNLFTTNYDLFIEKSIDNVAGTNRFIFNDGASGYFERFLDSSNYNRVVAYRGLTDNYLNEMPSISLIKPHGSMNWSNSDNKIQVLNTISQDPFLVKPTGFENKETFLSNHFYDMLRIFQLELDKSESVMFVIGFSFQDKHIAQMIRRALQNPELMIYAFGFRDGDRQKYMSNLGVNDEKHNFRIITPSNLYVDCKNKQITLGVLTDILNNKFIREEKGKEASNRAE
ncbi:SIR2 family protein [Lentilactobacillus hilgardii]|nr:SIR2 family protein [Lentilactobacillus hilgardii]TDG86310.1 hypothetical protein C5L34_001794 [Lentilactobacillus hilgardii]